MENWKCNIRLLCMWLSSCSSTICWKYPFFSFSVKLLLCQRSVDYISLGQFWAPYFVPLFRVFFSPVLSYLDFSSFTVAPSEVGLTSTTKNGKGKMWLLPSKMRWSSVQMWLWVLLLLYVYWCNCEHQNILIQTHSYPGHLFSLQIRVKPVLRSIEFLQCTVAGTELNLDPVISQ